MQVLIGMSEEVKLMDSLTVPIKESMLEALSDAIKKYCQINQLIKNLSFLWYWMMFTYE